ncbi:ribosome maturation factor [Candidatus Photodesmus blepharus]|uniref:Ribosome maturation factor RimM n=1 Tax=Candidatus Photodesmus blepharonis TaxID=1179155 RepID=A0A084CP55_9GAMM|nr:ribosome maturation factor RimM [Candidatus Photodesmus blepharus]KEY91584.1 ribosome maturation factor [Candidatus Photodesmus blepharus]
MSRGKNNKQDKKIIVGKFGSVCGIGWIRVHSYTENARDIFNYKPWFVRHKECWHQFKVAIWKQNNRSMLTKLESLNLQKDRNWLTNCEIFVDSRSFPQLLEDEFYWHELLGMQVSTVYGRKLGIVTSILETGSNDVLVVSLRNASKEKEWLIPFLEGSVIKKIVRGAQKIEVEWDPDF